MLFTVLIKSRLHRLHVFPIRPSQSCLSISFSTCNVPTYLQILLQPSSVLRVIARLRIVGSTVVKDELSVSQKGWHAVIVVGLEPEFHGFEVCLLLSKRSMRQQGEIIPIGCLMTCYMPVKQRPL